MEKRSSRSNSFANTETYVSEGESNRFTRKVVKTILIFTALFLIGGFFACLITPYNGDNTQQSIEIQVEPVKNITVSNSTGSLDSEDYLVYGAARIGLVFGTATMFGSFSYGVAFGPVGPRFVRYIGASGNYIVASMFASISFGLLVYVCSYAWEWLLQV